MREWSKLEKNQLSRSLPEPKCTPKKIPSSSDFFLCSYLTSSLQRFTSLWSYTIPTSHSATIGSTKVVGLIDRGGAQNLPLMLTAKFPDDLNLTGDDTYERSGIPDEDWNAVPHESPNEVQPLPHGWTSFGDTSEWPKVSRGANDQVDLTIRATTMIRRYYLHQHFGVCFVLRRNDIVTIILVTVLLAHAPYYLKFHGIITGGWTVWVNHAEWIRGTY